MNIFIGVLAAVGIIFIFSILQDYVEMNEKEKREK